jgi:NitT/TauT family transport system substrate-binding protein
MLFRRPAAGSGRLTLALVLLCAAALLAGCAAGSGNVQATSVTPVNVQLAWTHEFSSAGFYAAEKNGHFAREGLDVHLHEGGFGPQGYIEPIDQVLNGTHDFGIASASSILTARAAGKPVVAIGTIYQRSPLALISLPEARIDGVRDLVGKRVLVADGGARHALDALLSAQKIDPASLTVVPRTSSGVLPLRSHQVDAMVGWTINEGVELRAAELKPRFLMFSDFGVHSYDMLVFTTERIVKERPELARHFMSALVAGLSDVISDPARASGFVLGYAPKLEAKAQSRRLQASLPLIRPAGEQIGVMDEQIWEETAQMLIREGALARQVDTSQAYTLEFVADAQGR